MSIEVIKINLTAGDVSVGGTFLLPYPTGMAAGSYLSTGAKLTDNAGNVYNATVSLGASGITVTNPTGRVLKQSEAGYLQLSKDNVGAADSELNTPAYYATDASGNVTGLVGPDGSLIMQFVDVGGEASGATVEV